MALNPIPFVVADDGNKGDAPAGAVPIALYGAGKPPAPLPAILQALVDAGFGTDGQVLATNDTEDGFVWVDA